jgi:hypothetical protein
MSSLGLLTLEHGALAPGADKQHSDRNGCNDAQREAPQVNRRRCIGSLCESDGFSQRRERHIAALSAATTNSPLLWTPPCQRANNTQGCFVDPEILDVAEVADAAFAMLRFGGDERRLFGRIGVRGDVGEAGQYDRDWPDWHLGPEQAVEAHRLVRGKRMIPVHWGLLKLAHHSWTEPVERVLAAAKRRNVDVLAPRPGESIEATRSSSRVRWWPEIPWRSAHETPIVATRDGVASAL